MASTDYPARVELDLSSDSVGERLDKALAAALPDLSRARIQALLRGGHVQVDGKTALDPKVRVREGWRVSLELPPPIDATPAGQTIALDVLYEDADLIVIDKPAGLVVHPGAGHADGTLVNALIAHCGESLSGIGGVRRPGIVHRLDRDTSGVMVVAKSDAAHVSLSEQFAAHGTDGRLRREYRALVWGRFDRPFGTISARLARSEANRTRIAVVGEGRGRHAVTHWRLRRALGAGVVDVSELDVELETGRTHQIRVHMASVRHPVLADPVYGMGFKTREALLPAAARDAITALGRQALHARLLGFCHPITGEDLEFVSEPPADMAALTAALETA